MTEKQQVALKLVALIAVAGLMGLALYFLFFGGGPSISPPGEETPDEQATGGLPTAGEGVPGSNVATPGETGTGALPVSATADGGVTSTTRLTSASVFRPTPTSNNSIAYYDPRDGKFYTIDANGNVVLLSQASFPFAQNVTFSDQADAAVLEFPDGSNVVYNFNSGSQTTLPSHWEDFDFSADGSQIASKSVGTDPSNRSLVVTSVDGSKTSVIAPLGSNDNLVDVSWSPTGNIVGFSRTGDGGSAFGQNEIYLIGADGEAAGLLIVNGSNFKNIWSPNGANLLYSVADAGDQYRASLWYADARGDRTGDTRVRLSLKTTVDKCVFASSTLAYCAAPREMPAGGGSSRQLISAYDNLYKVELPSGRTSLIAIPEQDVRMYNLSVSASGDELYFTNDSGLLNLIQLD